MIRLTKNSLIIEIHSKNPTADLVYYKAAILGLLEKLEHDANVTVELWSISKLLFAMDLEEGQLETIIKSLKKTGDFDKVFGATG